MMNDFGSFLACVPSYFVIMYPWATSLLWKQPVPKHSLLSLEKEGTVDEILKDKSIDEIMATLDEEQKLQRQQVEQKFADLYKWYKIDNGKISQILELGGGFGLMGCSIVYMMLILRGRAKRFRR